MSMTDQGHLHTEIQTRLAAASTTLRHAWWGVDELGVRARRVEQAVDEAGADATRARVVSEEPQHGAYLVTASERLDEARLQCTVVARTAAEIEDHLGLARHHVDAASHLIDELEQTQGEPLPVAVQAGALRTKVEDLAGLIELAAPLAQAARVHMRAAAEAESLPERPSLDEQAVRLRVALQLDAGVQSAGRAVARTDEVSRHLARTVEHASAGANRSLGYIDQIAAASDRLRSAQQRDGLQGPPDEASRGWSR